MTERHGPSPDNRITHVKILRARLFWAVKPKMFPRLDDLVANRKRSAGDCDCVRFGQQIQCVALPALGSRDVGESHEISGDARIEAEAPPQGC